MTPIVGVVYVITPPEGSPVLHFSSRARARDAALTLAVQRGLATRDMAGCEWRGNITRLPGSCTLLYIDGVWSKYSVSTQPVL